jgi:hypothetical protein
MSISLWHGCAELLRSPSGVFSLLTLVAISVVTWHSPSVGGAAFVGFCSIIPALLGWTEHKEQLASMIQIQPAPDQPIVVDNPKGQ